MEKDVFYEKDFDKVKEYREETGTLDSLANFAAIITIIVLVLSLGIVLFGALAVWSGFVTTKLWNWIISRSFSVSSINIFQAIGLNLVISYFTVNYNSFKNDDDGWEEIVKKIAMAFAYPAVALLFGYVYQLFI